MSKAGILFLNNKAMDELGAASMRDVINDVERGYTYLRRREMSLLPPSALCAGETVPRRKIFLAVSMQCPVISAENMIWQVLNGSGAALRTIKRVFPEQV